ncbi:manganese transport system membrane protein MntD [Halolactibacillus alkaliphilus]|uniref:Manganese transport system membrane protein MntD n=1 Tax=Halolactibacillus alkaliphilus TaxID=442899 RepID=A0A511WYW1_9BACI|nr:metal ABC transporter permease [Halolactibacillus alkaliphilus]GEN55858.1 manganese transport system membrane protein MntD [Halolactibacillus alkaliphilus]GGN65896.1 manganese transport system membrane protein MntD [Halolactibacillus alkaliphilus]SFO66419.1 manganese/zinc/iron transport system permease protein [Halolactibacillus alkaliphilus]
MTYTAWIIITASLVGLSCGLIGVFLILRKTAMMADAISHTVLLGIVLAFLVTNEVSGPMMLIGGIGSGLLTAFLVQSLHSLGVQHDASMGIIFTTLFAIGVILISTSVGNAHLDIQHALMGEITFIPFDTTHLPLIGSVPKATLLLFSVFLIVLVFIIAFYKEWKITSFDPALAVSIGIPALAMHYLFMALVSVTTVASFDAVGAIMVVAMLITPASAAYLWTDRLAIMLILSSLFGVLAAISGYYIAVFLDASISGSMAFSTGIFFMVSFIGSPKHGLLSKCRRPSRANQTSI